MKLREIVYFFRQGPVRPVPTPERKTCHRRSHGGVAELPRNTILVYRNKTDRSCHHRIWLDAYTSRGYSGYKYARYDMERGLLQFSNQSTEGYATVSTQNGQICINSKKLVEQMFRSKKVEILPEGRTTMQIRCERSGIAAVRL